MVAKHEIQLSKKTATTFLYPYLVDPSKTDGERESRQMLDNNVADATTAE